MRKIMFAGFVVLMSGIAVNGWHERARSEFLAARMECVRHGEILMLGGELPYQPCLEPYINGEYGPGPWSATQPGIAIDRVSLWLRGYEPWDPSLERVKDQGQRIETDQTCFGANCGHLGQNDGER